jgi:hypothetical protein
LTKLKLTREGAFRNCFSLYKNTAFFHGLTVTYCANGILLTNIRLAGKNAAEKIFNSKNGSFNIYFVWVDSWNAFNDSRCLPGNEKVKLTVYINVIAVGS